MVVVFIEMGKFGINRFRGVDYDFRFGYVEFDLLGSYISGDVYFRICYMFGEFKRRV